MRRGPLAAGTAVLLSLTATAAWAPGAQAATPLPLPKALAGLPDGRGYERVSPADKSGAPIQPGSQAAISGDAVTFSSYGSFAGQPSAPSLQSYVGTRTATGWHTDPIGVRAPAPPQAATVNGPVRWSDDLRRQIVASGMSLTPGAPDFTFQGPYNGFGENYNLYRREADGGLTLLSGTEAEIPASDRPNFQAFVMATTDDLGKVLFRANTGLAGAPDATVAPSNLYLTTNGRDTENVGILPDGTPAPQGSYLAGEYTYGATTHTGWTAATKDLSRIFFMARPTASDPPQLYVRENAGKPGARTVLVSRSERATPDPLGAVVFRAASADGSKVMFTSVARLTDDAAVSADPENIQGDLYLYDVDRDVLTDLTAGHPEGTRLAEFAGAARDLSAAYFLSSANLAPGGTDDYPIGLNLYRWSADGLRFIASGRQDVTSGPALIGPGAAVSPDGDVLTFAAYANLTGYDTTDPRTGDHHVMRYVYDARRDTIACASCRPDGKPPTSNVTTSFGNPGTLVQGPQTLTADGRRVFFDSNERLTPGASSTQGKVYMYDVQQNTVSMISGGTSEFPDRFVDATRDGANAFFTTAQRLVGADDDDIPDLYVARVGGGFPEPPPPERPCRDDACQGARGREATPPVAGSSAQGAGNVTPAAVAKATVKVARPATATGTRATVRVTVSGVGRIAASGKGLRTASRTTTRRATYAVALTLTDRAARTLRARGHLAVKVRVTYAPRGGGAPARATVTVRFARRSASARRATASIAAEGQGR